MKQHSSAPLRVYAVWVPLPLSVSRDKWDATKMPDARVTQFWDGEHVISRWFASQVDGYEGVSWGFYYLYGPDAEWDALPSPLVDSGGIVFRDREKLKMQVLGLLGE
ncbi:MAG TPA: hypothetical protein VN843_08435 [Anaerolineales bacterium]|nr:hypothetical protein [Anaerolineales bacterium]